MRFTEERKRFLKRRVVPAVVIAAVVVVTVFVIPVRQTFSGGFVTHAGCGIWLSGCPVSPDYAESYVSLPSSAEIAVSWWSNSSTVEFGVCQMNGNGGCETILCEESGTSGTCNFVGNGVGIQYIFATVRNGGDYDPSVSWSGAYAAPLLWSEE
jgi:hypothetical protein